MSDESPESSESFLDMLDMTPTLSENNPVECERFLDMIDSPVVQAATVEVTVPVTRDAPIAPTPDPFAPMFAPVPAPVRRTRVTTPNPEVEIRARARAALNDLIRVAMTGTDGNYPYGCLAAWRKTGEVRWQTVATAAESCGFDPPAKRTIKAIAGEAVRSLKSQGFRVDVAIKGRSWRVYRPSGESILGTSVGETNLVVTLTGETLECDGPVTLAAIVQNTWEQARLDSIIGTADISKYLDGICAELRGVDTAYGQWLPPGPSTERWCRLATALHAAGLPVPATPASVTRPTDVASELATGLEREAVNLLATIEGQYASAAERGGGTTLGIRAATTALDDLASLKEKIALYEVFTGPLKNTHDEIRAMEDRLNPLVDGTVLRGSVLDLT